LTSLCYEESYVGRVLLLLGVILESIEFYKRGLIRPRVFIKKMLSKIKFKFIGDTCVSLASAIFGICKWRCLHKQVHLNFKDQGSPNVGGESSFNFVGVGRTNSGEKSLF
jgi:hypothetical protein